jgi:hypothetical protein
MKKVLSTVVAALVAMSFSAVVFAADVVKSDTKTETTTSPAGEVKVEKKEVKKVKKSKKAKKAKKVAVPNTETTTTTTEPAAK